MRKTNQILDCQHDFRNVEFGERFAEFAHLAEMKEELAARAIVEHKVQFVLGLECIAQRHDERVTNVLEHVSLSLGVFDLVALHHVVFREHFHCKHVARVDLAHEHDLAERALANHLEKVKVLETHHRVCGRVLGATRSRRGR
jgi:hypothetical protein